ncbi:MFS transporter [Bacillus sp. DNRA2]|nr:MFS transporter [Bacillus sp. DNRA2]
MNSQARFWILVSIVAISGYSQGMLLPLIAIIFEEDGLSSSVNGFHATALYIGVLLVAPFMEGLLRKIGYKPVILLGGIAAVISIALFPIWKSFWFWFILRLIIGIGDHMLHFGTQTWITYLSPANKRGRNLSLYGLFFGLGFAAGPFMTTLVYVNEALPFIVASALSLLGWLTIWLLKNEFPEKTTTESDSFFSTFSRFRQVFKFAWVAFLPPFGYGFLEASLNGNFPVYALRNGIDVSGVSIILPSFAIGGIIFQLPLGILSDRYGRKHVLATVMILGFICFTSAGLLQDSVLGLTISFFIAGMMVGSTFSLGISFMADLLPRELLPAGNLMCGIFYSIGSISGPFIGGLAIQFLPEGSFFFCLSLMLLFIFIALMLFRKEHTAHAKVL